MDDVLVVGGSFAGLAAALQLARGRKRVTVLDTNQPRNRFAQSAHGVPGFDGVAPFDLRERARADLLAYPTARIIEAEAGSVAACEDGFTITDLDRNDYQARRLILAYGVTDVMPDLPGFAACWGKTVLHCPYCHGYEVADRRLGLLYTSAMSLQGVNLIADWSDDMTLFANGNAVPKAERTKLERRGIKLVDEPVAQLRHDEGILNAVVLAGGEEEPLDALFGHPRTLPSAALHDQLQLERVDGPFGPVIKVDDLGKTSRDGVFAAGDCAMLRSNINLAVAAGTSAGTQCHQSLVD